MTSQNEYWVEKDIRVRIFGVNGAITITVFADDRVTASVLIAKESIPGLIAALQAIQQAV